MTIRAIRTSNQRFLLALKIRVDRNKEIPKIIVKRMKKGTIFVRYLFVIIKYYKETLKSQEDH